MSAKFDVFLKCENVGSPVYEPEKARAAFEAVSAPSAAEQANVEELRRIADAAEEQAKLAKAAAKAAQKDAQKAACRSRIAIGVSIITIIVDVILHFVAG